MRNWLSATVACAALMALSVSVDASPRTGGTWENVPNTHMRDVCADLHWPHQNGGCEMVINAWSGAAWDAQGRRMFVFGGGHGDYYGNEVYEFSLADRVWRRLTNPTPLTEGDQNHCMESFDGGQTPTARHSYWEQTWVPPRGIMIQHGGGYACKGGGSGNGTWSFDPAKAPQGAAAAWDYLEQVDTAHSASAGGGPLVWDPATQTLYNVGRSKLYEYDFDQNYWIALPSGSWWHVYPEGTNVALDTKRDRIWAFGPAGYLSKDFTVWYLDLTQRPYMMIRADTIWPNDVKPSLSAVGVAYDSKRDKLVLWCAGDQRCDDPSSAEAKAAQARRVYILDPDTLTWSIDNPPNGPRWNNKQRGTFGRWQYSFKDDVFVGVNSVDHDVWLYHPPTH